MTHRPPTLDVSRRTMTLVTRVPKAALAAVVAVNAVFVGMGMVLTVWCVWVLYGRVLWCGGGKEGVGVGDVQARLGGAALAARAFEAERWDGDAKGVEELFAEGRGMASGRVAVGRVEGGGRGLRFVQHGECL